MASGSQVGPEWVSISDLMSGVVGLMVVLFAVAALQVTAAAPVAAQVPVLEARLQRCQDENDDCRGQVQRCATDKQALLDAAQRDKDARDGREKVITDAFLAIDGILRSRNQRGSFEIDAKAHRIRMPDATFAYGSVEITDDASRQLREVAPRLREVLERYSNEEVFVEGHTDPDRVVCPSGCGKFDDNYTLSTARAAQARKIVIIDWPTALTDRVALAGYGASRPLAGASKAAQRRVEIIVRERPGAVP